MVMKNNLFSPFGLDLLLHLFLQAPVCTCSLACCLSHDSFQRRSPFLACTTSTVHTVLPPFWCRCCMCTSVVCTLGYRTWTTFRLLRCSPVLGCYWLQCSAGILNFMALSRHIQTIWMPCSAKSFHLISPKFPGVFLEEDEQLNGPTKLWYPQSCGG